VTLTSRLHAGGLMAPDYGGRNLGAVLPAAIAAVGMPDAVPGRDAEADRVHLGLGTYRHVIVVVVDGVGALNLEERRGHAPHLRTLMGEPLTAGFPTTTVTSLALLGTGQGAGRTGMVGYTCRNERTGALAQLISWEGAYAPQEWQRQPSLLQAAHDHGLAVTSLGKPAFAGSPLTAAALAGGSFRGVAELADRVDAALAATARPGITYLYWGEVDATGHRHGWSSHAWVSALEAADAELGRLARSLPRDVAMVLTADHGMVDVTGAPRWDVAHEPRLAQAVTLVAGEPRAVHVYTGAPGEEAEPHARHEAAGVAERWAETLGEHAVVMTREEAVAGGLFGEVDATPRRRIGDVVVAMTGRATVVDSRTQTPGSLALVGVHGSLTPEELLVPWALVEG